MRTLTVCVLLVAATVAVYAQVAGFEFVNFDDPAYVIDNPVVRDGLSLEGLRWAFTTGHASNWHPLTWLSHMVDCSLYGLDPAGHHLTNLALHLLNTCLVFLVLQSATSRCWPSALVAALFALHPLHVESVAWVAERKDLLCAMFGLLSIGAWVAYTKRPSIVHYSAALLLLAAGLMSKPMLVTLPFVLLLLDYWPLGRTGAKRTSTLRLILEKLPLLALAAASSVVTFLVQRGGGALRSADVIPLGPRLSNAVVSYASYLHKTFWPEKLSVFYSHPYLPGGEPLTSGRIAGAAALLLAVSAAVFVLRRRRYLTVGWLWFVGMLVPVIGLVQVGVQSHADRYSYLPSLGLFVAIAWGASELLAAANRQSKAPAPWLALLALLLLTPLAARTWFQARYWRDSFELYEHAVALDPRNSFAHTNLGAAYESEEMVHDAIEHFRAAVIVDPALGRAHHGLAQQLRLLEELDEAEVHFMRAIELEPRLAEARFNFGLMLRSQGRLDEAIGQYWEAVAIRPDYVDALSNLGIAFLARGGTEDAIEQLQLAVGHDPEHAPARNNLGVALVQAGRADEALGHFKAASAVSPDWPQPLLSQAWILATRKPLHPTDAWEAIRIAERAAELTGHRNPVILDALAAAYAAGGRFARAVATAESAARLADAGGRHDLAETIRGRIALYREGRPVPRELSPIP